MRQAIMAQRLVTKDGVAVASLEKQAEGNKSLISTTRAWILVWQIEHVHWLLISVERAGVGEEGTG